MWNESLCTYFEPEVAGIAKLRDEAINREQSLLERLKQVDDLNKSLSEKATDLVKENLECFFLRKQREKEFTDLDGQNASLELANADLVKKVINLEEDKKTKEVVRPILQPC